jgi:hypothetical protein
LGIDLELEGKNLEQVAVKEGWKSSRRRLTGSKRKTGADYSFSFTERKQGQLGFLQGKEKRAWADLFLFLLFIFFFFP